MTKVVFKKSGVIHRGGTPQSLHPHALGDLVKANRDEVIARLRAKVPARTAAPAAAEECACGPPLFVDRLIDRLHEKKDSTDDMVASATTGGKEMWEQGFTVAQVVQGYSDVCAVVTGLAIERQAPIAIEEFQLLSHCLGIATGAAVGEFERQRDRATLDQGVRRLGFLAHELRNRLNSAVISFDIIKHRSVGVEGRTAAVLSRSLSSMGDIIDQALADVRHESGAHRRERIRISEFVEDVKILGIFEANKRGLDFTVTCVDAGAEVEIDRHALVSAVGNLLQNAFKFTRESGRVALKTHVAAGRVLIDIEDECGGIPPGTVAAMFRPFEQGNLDRTGLGLGLTISRQGVEAYGGEIHVRDLPGKGCVFTIDLPKASTP